jgi:uncharacterized protein with PIN domain
VQSASFRFYAELNDFVPAEKRQQNICRPFVTSSSVKDMIESLGVPHTEVDLILANGQSVDFFYGVQNGDRISVYPMFESFDISTLLRVRTSPLRVSRFVLDSHLGRLATYLRMLGFHALYRNDYQDAELARIEHTDKRILLTRDRALLMRRAIDRGYFVRGTNPRLQLLEVVRRFDLAGSATPFARCLNCNGLLQPVDKESIEHRLAPRTKTHFQEFQICPSCNRIYWKGSHYQRMVRFLDWLKEQDAA